MKKKVHPYITNKRLHVFLADDDPEDVEHFQTALKEISSTIKITIAKDGRELLEFVRIVTPDMIFLDMNMPCMNGIDCLSELRRMEHLQHVPIIIYSTGTKAEQIDQSYALGANRYIKKPVHFASIKEELSKIVALNLSDLVPQPPRDKYLIEVKA
jgi:CheY-like chemotaxis protein